MKVIGEEVRRGVRLSSIVCSLALFAATSVLAQDAAVTNVVQLADALSRDD